jgi:mannose-6-phosphate isomerase-like protein (cupin superfamily)
MVVKTTGEEAVRNSETWPPELDALAAAPGNHTVLFENDSVRVLDTSIAAGQKTPLHTHRWPAALYILSWSDFVRRDEQGQIVLDSRQMTPLAPGTAIWTPALAAHTLENLGTNELRVIAVEMKEDRNTHE